MDAWFLDIFQRKREYGDDSILKLSVSFDIPFDVYFKDSNFVIVLRTWIVSFELNVRCIETKLLILTLLFTWLEQKGVLGSVDASDKEKGRALDLQNLQRAGNNVAEESVALTKTIADQSFQGKENDNNTAIEIPISQPASKDGNRATSDAM